jgi:hypothetical protein
VTSRISRELFENYAVRAHRGAGLTPSLGARCVRDAWRAACARVRAHRARCAKRSGGDWFEGCGRVSAGFIARGDTRRACRYRALARGCGENNDDVFV